MRSLLISLLVVLLAATIQAGVFKKEKVKLGKKNCLCDFNIEIGDTCSGSVKCDKKCSGSGTVELGGCSFTLAVKKGKGKISKCSCEAATLPVPTEPTIGPGSGETPVPMTGSGSGETPVPMTGSGSGETPVPIPTSPGSGSGGEGMQCSCKCNCPDGSGECDCDCNCPMTSKTVTCAPGFSAVCPMMGDMCPQDMDPICPHNAISRMGGNTAEGMDKGCQCVPDFLLAMVMIQPTGRMEAVDRAMTKATIQVGKKKCKCSYEMNPENCKKSKIVCDKKCSGKESGVELADGDVMYMVDIAVKKGKVTIAKCDVEAPEPTGTGGGSTGSGSGNGEGGMGGMVSRCACVSKGMGGSGPTVPTLPPTGSGSEPAPPTGSGSEPAPPTGSGSEPAPPTGSGSEPAPPTGSGSGSGQDRGSTVCGDELKHLFASMPANITFTVQCCNGAEGESYLTKCGAGKPCETACGNSPVGLAQVVAGDHGKGEDYCSDQQCYQCGRDRDCQALGIVIYIPCFHWVDSLCNHNQVIDNGNNCPALYGSIGLFSVDFCCYCNSVFNSCLCDCCKCRNVGVACNENCEDYICP